MLPLHLPPASSSLSLSLLPPQLSPSISISHSLCYSASSSSSSLLPSHPPLPSSHLSLGLSFLLCPAPPGAWGLWQRYKLFAVKVHFYFGRQTHCLRNPRVSSLQKIHTEKVNFLSKGKKGKPDQPLGQGVVVVGGHLFQSMPFCHAVALLNSYSVDSYVNDILSSLIASAPLLTIIWWDVFLPLNLSIFQVFMVCL